MAGDNVWEYWFAQPGGYSPGAAHVRGQPVASLQVTTVESISETPIRTYGPLAVRVRGRVAAHALLGTNGTKLVRAEIRQAAARLFAPWRARSKHILGVHLRGTDKVVRPKVPALLPDLPYPATSGPSLPYLAASYLPSYPSRSPLLILPSC